MEPDGKPVCLGTGTTGPDSVSRLVCQCVGLSSCPGFLSLCEPQFPHLKRRLEALRSAPPSLPAPSPWLSSGILGFPLLAASAAGPPSVNSLLKACSAVGVESEAFYQKLPDDLPDLFYVLLQAVQIALD